MMTGISRYVRDTLSMALQWGRAGAGSVQASKRQASRQAEYAAKEGRNPHGRRRREQD